MTLTIANRLIESVQIIDDDPNVRESYRYVVEDLKLKPVSINALHNLDQFVQSLQMSGNSAVICDYHLRTKNYATSNGAEVVAKLYQSNIPSILCTRYDTTIEEIREHRQYIPALIRPEELDPDNLEYGLRQCIEELEGNYLPSRRSWRTLIDVEDVDETRQIAYVLIPGWDPHQVVSVPLAILPPHIKKQEIKKQRWFHAKVNIGAENMAELYFERWEIG